MKQESGFGSCVPELTECTQRQGQDDAGLALSVLIVAYRSGGEIADCLRSIPRTVGGRDVEVIVVENKSNESIGHIVSQDFPWVRYRGLDENVGFGRANNLAYEMAHGECILFLNPDTVLNEQALTHCWLRLRQEHDIGILSPKLVTLDGQMDLACRRSIPTVWDGFCRAVGLAARFPRSKLFAGYNLTYLPEGGTYDVGSVNGAFMMCPRKALLRVGVFDEQYFMYGDDLDLNHRFRQAGYRVVYDGRVSIVHIKGASSSQEPEKMAREVFLGSKQFYLKHFNPHRSTLVRWKYELMFGLWQRLAAMKAWIRGQRSARPL